MIDRFEIIKNKEEIREFIELTGWIWNSHWWIEYHPGYCKCKWCGATHTSEMGINKDFPLCEKNPAIEKLLTSHRFDALKKK